MKKAMRALLILLGACACAAAAALLLGLVDEASGHAILADPSWLETVIVLACAAAGGIAAAAVSGRIMARLEALEKKMQAMPPADILITVGGLVVGLVVAYLLNSVVGLIPWKGVDLVVSVLLYCVLAMLGCRMAYRKRDEIRSIRLNILREASADAREARRENKSHAVGVPKILDTSVIIDGRIHDVLRTGFLEGPLVVHRAVLDELRHIADSPDELRRVRGRRGLEILARIQKEGGIEVEIATEDDPEIQEVDAKLLWLAQRRQGKVVTNDYNLNKVARVQKVPVLNINDLANAIKSVVIAGEPLVVQIVKEGKEAGQGVAYLDDGTMVVVENGTALLGKKVTVTVTSALQTSAGRMIFARPEEN